MKIKLINPKYLFKTRKAIGYGSTPHNLTKDIWFYVASDCLSFFVRSKGEKTLLGFEIPIKNLEEIYDIKK